MTVIPGDPASLSACASTAAACAQVLSAQARALRPALEAATQGWGGRSSLSVRRRGSAVVEATATLAGELERLSRALQDQATDLAGLVARARSVQERAAAGGLTVRDERVVPAYGVIGVADADASHGQASLATTLQAELDLLLAQHRRRRDFVLALLRESTARLAEASHGVRRG